MDIANKLQNLSNTFLFLNTKRKTIVLSVLICVSGFIIALIFIQPTWIYSFAIGGFSYIVLMIVSFNSIHAKIQDKIAQANKEQLLEQYTPKYDKDLYEEDSQEKTTEKKKLLRFIDLSKVSLGFELSFSLSRILTFFGIVLSFIVLVWLQVFYPIAYILGVFISSILVVLYFFMLSWNENKKR